MKKLLLATAATALMAGAASAEDVKLGVLIPAYSPNPARLASIGGFAARDVLSLGL